MKKLLSLLAVITLTVSGTSSVVSCNNAPIYNQNNIDIVNSIINTLKQANKYGVKELSSGSHLFKDYKNNVLEQIQNKIIKNYRNFVSFKSDQDNITLTNSYKTIVLTIKNGNYIKTLNVYVRLGYDAQSIANKLKDTNNYVNILGSNIQTISNYEANIKIKLNQKLRQDEIAACNITLINPDQLLISSLKNVSIQVKVGSDIVNTNVKVALNYKKITEISNIEVVKKINDKTFIGTLNTGLYISNDGQNFTQVGLPISNNSYINLIQKINGKIYVGTLGNGLFYSNDSTWTSFTKVDTISNNYIRNIKEINNKIYIGTDYGLYTSSNNEGTYFTKVNSVINNSVVLTIEQIGSKIYVGTHGSGLYISNDLSGTNFKILNSIIDIRIIIQINNKIYLGTGNNGLYVSIDSRNFKQVESISKNAAISNIQQINNKIYVGTSYSVGLYISNDLSGTSFSKVNSISNSSIHSITQINNNIYVGTSIGLYVSTNQKIVFSKVNTILNSATINTIVKAENKIYVGAIKGLYYNFV